MSELLSPLLPELPEDQINERFTEIVDTNFGEAAPDDTEAMPYPFGVAALVTEVEEVKPLNMRLSGPGSHTVGKSDLPTDTETDPDE